jgi:hypothetical protein
MLQISKAWFASAAALSSVLPFLRCGDAGRPKAVVPSPVAMLTVTSTIYYCYARVSMDGRASERRAQLRRVDKLPCVQSTIMPGNT